MEAISDHTKVSEVCLRCALCVPNVCLMCAGMEAISDHTKVFPRLCALLTWHCPALQRLSISLLGNLARGVPNVCLVCAYCVPNVCLVCA